MKEIKERKDVEFLIDAFYKKVVEDDVIGHFFNTVVKMDWSVHIPIMYDFWESILFAKPVYKGNPMLKHIELDKKEALKPHHFERWLSLWESTVRENFVGEKSEMAISRANQIGNLMKFKVGQQHQSNG